MLRKLRIALATLFLVGITLLFLDFTGLMHVYLGWMAKIQFWPAFIGSSLFALVAILLTLVFGRIYCSVICPMGVLQDVIARLGRIGRRNPYSFSKEKAILRYVFFALMGVPIPFGLSGLLDPYSAFGRIANTMMRPVWIFGNNLLAGMAEHYESYMFYRADVLMTTGATLAIAVVTFIIVAVLAAKNGRTYCNTICPIGTLLGFVSRASVLKIAIDTDKCKNCGKCAKNCKAACIDVKNHKIDYSRCVVCGNCLEECEFLALSYGYKTKGGFNSVVRGLKPMKKREAKIASDFEKKQTTDAGRRGALVTMAMATTAAALAQEKKKLDGGLAVIEDKQMPERQTRILPPGAKSDKHFHHHCTACQLCVSACPNKVLRPSTELNSFMQPYVSYEEGYCRPECHACSDVCPAGALHKMEPEVKVSTQIGRAVVIKKNCLAANGTAECGNCERHCPSGAIQMVKVNPDDENSPKMPTVDETRCIGCGACENLCPSRPFSAIYVEGLETQKEI